jgi:hypothetical protein
MLHVWIEPHKCGPFAALEGVGAGQIKEGEARLCDTAQPLTSSTTGSTVRGCNGAPELER